MSTRRRRAEDGFTLLEVIVAAFLLGVGLIATAQLVVMATGQVALARQQSDAASLAQQTVEVYRDENFANLLSTVVAAGGSQTVNTTPTVGSQTYNVQTSLQANTPQANTITLVVTVTWNGGQSWSGGKSYVTQTILSPLQ
ncbi:MAG TPA: prepilin-type N-terminal cleavage/methylation domain-containing protein [bacterium]|nr:prepilin-type N-terminal cleavage/methylation domain-containing protein [bacterium]